MKISCNVIKDILPLYVEDLASEDTRKVVDEHIDQCHNCKKELEDMQVSTITPIDTDMRPLEKIRDSMRRKKLQTILFTSIITIVIAIALMAFLTAPEYLNDVTSVSIVENSDGTIVANFDEEVSGYDLEKRGSEYVITTWDSIWSRNVSRNHINSVVLNPDGEKVESVYYYYTDGRLDALKYGRNQYENGGVMTLPRLALAYYLTLAFAIIGICLMVKGVFRGNQKARNIITKIMLLPVSYILGHILIKGFSTSSYSMARDFYAILLAMIGIYAAILLAMNIVRKSNKNIF